MIHKTIDLYGSDMSTAKGERFLTSGASGATSQGRNTTKMITEVTGQSLKGTKMITGLKRVNPLRLIKR
jgi:hypothetical protein